MPQNLQGQGNDDQHWNTRFGTDTRLDPAQAAVLIAELRVLLDKTPPMPACGPVLCARARQPMAGGGLPFRLYPAASTPPRIIAALRDLPA